VRADARWGAIGVTVSEGDEQIAERRWEHTTARDLQ